MLECRVCDNVFGVQGDKIPRLLFCGHTFCHSCLSRLPQSIPNLIETESGSEVSANIFIQCPFDRQPTTLGTYFTYHSSPRQLPGKKNLSQIISKQQFGFAISTT